MESLYYLINKMAHMYLFLSIIHFFVDNQDIIYNEKIIKKLVSISIKLMEYYSTGEIFFNKMKKNIKTYIEANPELNNLFKKLNNTKPNLDNIEFIKDGDIVNKMPLINFINQYKPNSDYDLQKNTDFCIYSHYNGENEPINKIIIKDYENFTKKYLHSKENNLSDNEWLEPEVGYKFIMFEILINEIPISINLTTEKYNYLIINNIIDIYFIKYFLKKYHHNIYHKLNENDIQLYKIKIIDHNINVLEFSNKPLIIHKDNGITYANNDLKNTEDEKLQFMSEEKYSDKEDYDCIDSNSYYKYN